MTKYRASIEFATDRPLTEDELDVLGMTVFVQVDEPVDVEGDSAEWSVIERPTISITEVEDSSNGPQEVTA